MGPPQVGSGLRRSNPRFLAARSRRGWVAILTVVACAAALTGAMFLRGQGSVNQTLDWETGDISQTTGLECPSTSTDFAIVNSPVRQGNYAARFHIDANSGLWGNGVPRCMATLYNSAETTGNDYYYGFSFYLPQVTTNNNLWELHSPARLYDVSPNCALAPLALATRRGGLSLRIATGNCDGVGWAHFEPHIPIPGVSRQPVGKWVDFVIHLKFAESATGTVELWARTQGNPWPGSPLIARYGIPTMPYSDAANVHNVGLYTEIGLYPPYQGYTSSDTVYFDGSRRGSSFAAVAPR